MSSRGHSVELPQCSKTGTRARWSSLIVILIMHNNV